jgi:lipoyl(octanoyl) transferase
VTDTDRGGRVTYHGPGQLVAYPIVSLLELRERDDVAEYISRMERAIIATLGDWDVPAQVIEGLTGVWTEGDPTPAGTARKIASIGIHVNRSITTHGLAINVNNDLRPFEWIVPCGIEAVRMTSVREELGSEQDFDSFAKRLTSRFGEVYERELVEIGVDELAARIDGIEPLLTGTPAPVGLEA